MNLIGNAIKFTKHGKVTLRVSLQGRDRLVFDVEDTGIGIEKNCLTTLFNPFAQADSGITRQFGGTGLGLYICRSLARLMGGEVRAESEVGKGSQFSVDLPIALEEPVEWFEDYQLYDMRPGGLKKLRPKWRVSNR